VNSARQRSMVVESSAYRLWLRSTPNRIVSVQWPRDADQDLSKITIDAPVVNLVGVGESGARPETAPSDTICPGVVPGRATWIGRSFWIA
jgi:hypothetical protein